MQVKVYNNEGKESSTAELPDGVFGLKWNAALVQQVLISQLSNLRMPIAHAKDRAHVRGGGKKPWRQKGTGRARHGSIRSPIWKGGGVTHGPLKEKNYKKKINKKMARKALFTVLSAKAREDEIIVVDSLSFPEGKTKAASSFFKHLSENESFKNMTRGNGALVALAGRSEGSTRAMRNIPFIAIDEIRNLNAHEVLQYRYVVFAKEGVEQFVKRIN